MNHFFLFVTLCCVAILANGSFLEDRQLASCVWPNQLSKSGVCIQFSQHCNNPHLDATGLIAICDSCWGDGYVLTAAGDDCEVAEACQDSNCQVCSDPAVCTQCNAPFKTTNLNTCVNDDNCAGWTIDATGLYTACSSCWGDYIPEGFTCVPKPAAPTCQVLNCDQCSDSPNYCNICFFPYQASYLGNCINTADPNCQNFVFESQRSENTVCQVCAWPFKLSGSNVCKTFSSVNCAQFGFDDATGETPVCKSCYQGWDLTSGCTNPSCDEGAVYFDPAKYDPLNGVSCQSCLDNCHDCHLDSTQDAGNTCDHCYGGFYLDATNNLCPHCSDQNCQFCALRADGSRDDCQRCWGSNWYFDVNHLCAYCGEKRFPPNPYNADFSQPCLDCTDANCKICVPDLVSGNVCQICEDTFFLDQNGNCTPCSDPNCQTCSYDSGSGADICSLCKPTFDFDPTDNVCTAQVINP